MLAVLELSDIEFASDFTLLESPSARLGLRKSGGGTPVGFGYNVGMEGQIES